MVGERGSVVLFCSAEYDPGTKVATRRYDLDLRLEMDGGYENGMG